MRLYNYKLGNTFLKISGDIVRKKNLLDLYEKRRTRIFLFEIDSGSHGMLISRVQKIL
jgi:hypothetical protein